MTTPRWLTPPLAALQFLTRIPTPPLAFDDRTLPRAASFFPLVGTLLALLAAALHHVLTPHFPPLVTAAATITLLVCLTGAMHEDALADCADAFGLRRPLDRTLAIMRDSNIGSFGGAALALSLLTRTALLASIPADRTLPTLVAALTLGRWSTLPLTLLPPARPEAGQGTTIAQRTSPAAILLGTAFTLAVLAAALRSHAFIPALAAVLMTSACAFFFFRRIGGTTGDCFGATNQLVEIAVLACGAWHP